MSDCEQWSIATHEADKRLLQLRVFRFGLLQDGDVGVGVFPEREEVLVGGASLSSVAGERVGTGKAEMGQRPEWEIQYDSTMFEELLKLCGRGGAVMGH